MKIFFNMITILMGLIIGIVLSILMLEIALCACPKLGYNYSSFQASEHPCLRMWNTTNQKYWYQPSSLLGYEHVPNCKPYTNRYGLMGKEYDLKKDKGVYRILLLGDSIAEQAEGIAADFLEGELNKGLSGINRFEIWKAPRNITI